MEVVTASPNGTSPFHNHDVREWSRLDRLTGVLERARLESDHWTINSNNATQKYGKVIDSRARSTSNGNQLAQAQRQLEVYQSHHKSGAGTTTTTNSRLQVIKTQTAVVSTNNSRYSQQQQQNIARNSNKTTAQNESGIVNKDTDIVRGNNDLVDRKKDAQELQGFDSLQLTLNPLDLTSQKSKASVGRSVGRRPPSRSRLKEDISTIITTSASNNQSSYTPATPAAAFHYQKTTAAATNLHHVSKLCHQIHETAVKSTFANTTLKEDENRANTADTNKPVLTRTKSTSSDDLHEKTFNCRCSDDLQDLEQLQNWRRTSKLRRSLQYPQKKNTSTPQLDLPKNKGSVRKIREDLETGRRLNTALRGNTVDLDAMDQILQSIKVECNSDLIVAKKTNNKSSFVTVASIADIRSRLRRTNSSEKEDTDDGIVTEDNTNRNVSYPSDSVKSYVFGMESMLGNGTGSLESRTKYVNGNTSSARNEDWYSRRKSYGFERVVDDESSVAYNKTTDDSSTDSGICRSTEIVLVPTARKVSCDYPDVKNRRYNTAFDLDDENPFSSKKATEELANIWNKRASLLSGDINSPAGDGSSENPSWDSNRDSLIKTTTNHDDFKHTSRNSDVTDEDTLCAYNRRNNKKVEFCKTEVHFVADSGRVNIVETDDKPPPTQNFRRRRRNLNICVLNFNDDKIFNADEETIQQNNNPPLNNGVVTVNITIPQQDHEDQKENYENDTPRGILKNKPLKPYILGDDVLITPSKNKSCADTVRNLSSGDAHAPVWRSTVTVRNTFYDIDDASSDNECGRDLCGADAKMGDLCAGRCSPVDLRRSSWSVADRVKHVEDHLCSENKGYSTRINIGNGEATVVENRHPTWPRRDEDIKRNVLNKRLVLRIGKTEPNTNHIICSKTTTNPHQNATTTTTTTTKITIDLNPSPTHAQHPLGDLTAIPTIHKFPTHSFKSPSLIMNTIKTESLTKPPSLISDQSIGNKIKIPQQLEALRRLYEDVQSDSEADKEVQSLMSKNVDIEGDSSSIVSGSWSKLTAFNHFNNYTEKAQLNNAHVEKVTGLLNYSQLTEKSHSAQIISPFTGDQQKFTKYTSSPSEITKQNVFTCNNKIGTKSVEVLRQPKRSQMAYFGVKVSPATVQCKNKTTTKLTEKPDLLQFNSNIDNYKHNNTKPNIYAATKREFDDNNKILEELTKAADEILQAVNGYTDEENIKQSTPPELLETISESERDYNKKTALLHHQKSTTASRLKRASSTSSVDSISKECVINTIRKSNTIDKSRNKKSPASFIGDKLQTKARRLQRANSREALLQSHGSSSEDLTVGAEVPARKPRLVKRTRTNNNDAEVRRCNKDALRRKADDDNSVSLGGVVEIRYKTAVSTIRSTAEKVAASRERAKLRNDVKKRLNCAKKDHIKGAPLKITTSDSRSTVRLLSTGRQYNTTHSSAPYRAITSANTPFLKKQIKSDGLTK